MHAMLVIGRPGWLAVTVAIVAGGIWLVWRSYRAASVAGRIRAACAALKLLAVTLVAVSLVEPLWSGVRPVAGENIVAILADASRSLSVVDSDPVNDKAVDPRPSSRGERMKRCLSGDRAQWQTSLAHDFDVRRYQFAVRTQPLANFDGLEFSGPSTEITGSLKEMIERYRGRPLAGIVCLTDGTSSDLVSPIDTTGWPPVYPVVVANNTPGRDVAVESVSVSQSPFEDAPVTICADVVAHGYAGRKIVARILEGVAGTQRVARVEAQRSPQPGTLENSRAQAGGSQSLDPSHPSGATASSLGAAAPLDEQSQTATADVTRLSFRFQVRPTASGVRFYRVEAYPADADKAAEGEIAKPQAAEVTLENNRRLVAVDRGSGPHRVLYVSGRPNWEFKFLNRAVADDPQLQLAAMIRIARREAKFDFRGRAGESSNPLFRGFRKDGDEETERFDEPVLVRLNMKDANELRAGFPKSLDDLSAFRAIVVDDLEAGFFTRDQLALLEQFVTERGGGLMMLGGTESFRQGDWNNTSVGRMLPVYLDRAATSGDASDSLTTPRSASGGATKALGSQSLDPSHPSYRLDLTRDGWLLPWMRLRRTETEEQARLAEMPEFRTYNAVGGIKPGAMVAATVSQDGGPSQPALVVQRYGRGTTAALTIGDLWRWPLSRKESDAPDDLGRAWRQTLRWLVADVPDRVSVRVESTAGSASAMTIRVTARDAAWQPLDNAAVRLTVTPPEGAPVEMTAEPSLEEPGVFTALYAANAAGGYRVTATARGSNGKDVGTAETGWVSDPATEEFRSLVPNRAALETLARQTGGEIIPLDHLDELSERLANRPAPIVEEWSHPLWHQWWFFAAAILCLGGEWTLRRWNGLA